VNKTRAIALIVDANSNIAIVIHVPGPEPGFCVQVEKMLSRLIRTSCISQFLIHIAGPTSSNQCNIYGDLKTEPRDFINENREASTRGRHHPVDTRLLVINFVLTFFLKDFALSLLQYRPSCPAQSILPLRRIHPGRPFLVAVRLRMDARPRTTAR
jgi:hypothetical protein